jgi:hypothetical protein
VLYPEKFFGMSGKFFWDDLPSPSPTFPGEKFLGAFFIQKVPLKAWPPPQLLEASYAPDSVLGLRKKGFVEEPRILQ